MPDAKITDLGDGGLPQPTDDFVVARGATNNKLAWSSLAAAATEGNIAVTLSGNTAGALAGISSGTLTIAGGNNITLSQAGNAITISGPNVGGAQTGISGLANSQTTYTSGTVSLSELGAITIRSSTGQHFQFQVPQTSSLSATGAVSISTNGSTISVGAPGYSGGISTLGNTSGDTGYASQRLNLVGGNNITLSGSTDGGSMSLTISGPNVGGAQTGISGLANSETTYTSGSVTLSALGAVTIRSTTGQHFQISVNSQSVQPETQTFIAGVSASDTLYTSGNVRITGVGGGVTVSSNTGQRIDISVAAPVAQTNQSGNVYASSNTFGTSSGTYDARSISIAGRGAVSVAASNSGWVISAPAQTEQTQNAVDVTLSGNTAGALALVSSGTLTLAGGNNITLSQAGNAVTISGGAGGAFSAGMSTEGNTAGDTGVTGSRLVFVGSNNITLSQTQGAAGATLSFNALASSSLSATGAVSISVNGSTISIGAPAQTEQTQSRFNLTLSGNSTSAGAGYIQISSGVMTLAGGNNVTLSQNGNAVTISGPNVGGAQTGISGVVASDATYTSGTVIVSGVGGGVTINSNTGQRVDVSVAAPVAQTNQAGSVYAISNTSGTSSGTYDARTLSIAGAGLVTVAASNSGWRIDASNQNLSVGASNVGNTSGDTTVNTGSRLVFAGGNNITVSQGTAAGATTITISGGAAGGGGGTASNWPLYAISTQTVPMTSAMYATEATRTTMSANVWPLAFELPLSVNRVFMPIFISVTSASTNSNWSWTLGQSLGLYTMNAGTLSLVSSFSNQNRVSYASTNNSTNASASWQMSYGSGTDYSSSTSLSTNNAGATNLWSSFTSVKAYQFAQGDLSLPAGQYLGVWAFSSSSAGANLASMTGFGVNTAGVGQIHQMGQNLASTAALSLLQGRASLTQTNTGLAASFASTDMTTLTNNVSIINRPMIVSLNSH